jgi:hypothetical protein
MEGGSTLDSFFKLGSDYVRARYSRTPDPALQGNQAVPIPVETVVQGPRSSSSDLSPVVMVAAAVALLLIVGLALKKAG